MSAAVTGILPTLPGHADGIVAATQSGYTLQCSKCGTTAPAARGHLLSVMRTTGLHFHARLPEPWDKRRLCRPCRLGFGCACGDCNAERRPS